MRTIEQARAADALARAKEVEDKSFSARYRSYVDRLGPTIVMNGLGQALATELAATGIKEAHRKLYDCVASWLCRGDGGIYPGEPDLLQAIVSNNRSVICAPKLKSWRGWSGTRSSAVPTSRIMMEAANDSASLQQRSEEAAEAWGQRACRSVV